MWVEDSNYYEWTFENTSSMQDVDIFKWKVESLILCPNCWIYYNTDFWCKCWYWKIRETNDLYFNLEEKKKNKRKAERNEKMKWNWKEYFIWKFDWNELYFYNHFWNIHSTKANLKIKYKWNIYKINVKYSITEDKDFNDTNNSNSIHKKSIDILPPIKIDKYNKSKHKHEWKEVYFDYKLARDIVFEIVNKTEFNKHLEIK